MANGRVTSINILFRNHFGHALRSEPEVKGNHAGLAPIQDGQRNVAKKRTIPGTLTDIRQAKGFIVEIDIHHLGYARHSLVVLDGHVIVRMERHAVGDFTTKQIKRVPSHAFVQRPNLPSIQSPSRIQPNPNKGNDKEPEEGDARFLTELKHWLVGGG